MKRYKIESMLAVVALLLFATGCGEGAVDDQPDMGQVTGTITMDGSPLADAQVTFRPEKGRAASGRTDSSGKYELIYVGETKGAKIGSNKVSITTPQQESPEEGEETKKPKEKIPAQYNSKTTLTADVKAGENVFDFELKSK